MFEHIPLLPPATKFKLREGNVCQSFCSWGGGMHAPCHTCPLPLPHMHTCSLPGMHASSTHAPPCHAHLPPPCMPPPQRIPRDADNEWTVHILLECMLVTTRKRSLGQGNIFTSLCHSVHKGGGVPGQVPPSPGQVHHPPRYTPPGAVHAGRYGQQAGGTHPTGMHSCFQIETIA